MNDLPTSLAGWQAIADYEHPKHGDLAVIRGTPVYFVEWDYDNMDAADIYSCWGETIYRKLPVAKAGDLDHLPTEAKARKDIPICTGVLDYFPLALIEVAKCSFAGNKQHNPDKPVHWDRSKSTDEADALLRHLMQRGTVDTDGVRHSAKVCWRGLALLQKEMETLKNKE